MESVTQGHMIGAHLVEKRMCRVLSTRPRQSTASNGVRSAVGTTALYQGSPDFQLHETDRNADMAPFPTNIINRTCTAWTWAWHSSWRHRRMRGDITSVDAGLSFLYHVESGRREMRGSARIAFLSGGDSKWDTWWGFLMNDCSAAAVLSCVHFMYDEHLFTHQKSCLPEVQSS